MKNGLYYLFILLLCTSCSFDVKYHDNDSYNDMDIINSIVSYNSDLDYGFLEYIYKEDGRKSLIKIE